MTLERSVDAVFWRSKHSFDRFCAESLEAIQLRFISAVERVKGFEPSTSCLGSKHSSAELHPL